MHRTGLRRLRAGIEPVPVPHLLRAERRGEIAVRPVHFARDERVGSHPVGRRGAAVVHVAHERRPGGRDDLPASGVVLEDALLDVVSDPDPRDELGRVPDEPRVGVVVGRAGLAGRRQREPGLPHGREGGAAADHVLHHVHHEPGVLGVHHGLAVDRRLPQDVALPVFDSQDADRLGPRAEGGERSVGGDDLHRPDAARADVNGGIRRQRRGDAVAARLADDRLLTQRHAQLDRREVT